MGFHIHGHHGHGHHDGHAHEHEPSDRNQKVLVRALAVTVVFMFFEAVGGYLSNSLALLSDAGHMLTDVGGMLLSLFAVWMARRPTTKTMSFGYHRAEILGALGSGLSIWVLAGFLISEAVRRIGTPQPVHGGMVFVIATVGLMANLISMKLLHSAQSQNLNVRGAYLHVIFDALGSVGAMIAGAVLWFTGWTPIDPIVTIVMALFMLYSSWDLIRESVVILMESTPRGMDPHEIQTSLERVEGVREVHDLHVWAVTSGRYALSVHLISEQGESVLNLAHALLKENYGIQHTTIQVEHPDRFQSERCYDCAPEGSVSSGR